MEEYDENGFDKAWNHKITGTRFDENGFNKDGTIHMDTRLPKDKYGHRREYYKNGYTLCFDNKIGELFFKNDNLNIINRFVGDFTILNKDCIEQAMPIKFKSHTIKEGIVCNGPRCLDGTPDMRYNQRYTTTYTTNIIIYDGNINIEKAFPEKISEIKIREAIDEYNFVLFAIKDECVEKFYTILININNKCRENKEACKNIEIELKEKKAIFKELEVKQDIFSEEQRNKFEELKKNIKQIEEVLNNIESFEKEFINIYKEMLIRFDELKSISKKNDTNDYLNKLFSKIGNL